MRPGSGTCEFELGHSVCCSARIGSDSNDYFNLLEEFFDHRDWEHPILEVRCSWSSASLEMHGKTRSRCCWTSRCVIENVWILMAKFYSSYHQSEEKGCWSRNLGVFVFLLLLLIYQYPNSSRAPWNRQSCSSAESSYNVFKFQCRVDSIPAVLRGDVWRIGSSYHVTGWEGMIYVPVMTDQNHRELSPTAPARLHGHIVHSSINIDEKYP